MISTIEIDDMSERERKAASILSWFSKNAVAPYKRRLAAQKLRELHQKPEIALETRYIDIGGMTPEQRADILKKSLTNVPDDPSIDARTRTHDKGKDEGN